VTIVDHVTSSLIPLLGTVVELCKIISTTNSQKIKHSPLPNVPLVLVMSLLYIFHGGGSKNFEKRGAIDNVSASSSFIANAHNELCLLHEKKGLFEKK